MALLFSASASVAAQCADDPTECTLKKLCEVATTVDGGNTTWSTATGSAEHVTLAQSLGMECGVTPIVDLCDTDPNECKVSQICGKATTDNAGQKSWDDSAAAYVAKAKEYGMSCDVVVQTTSVEKVCSAETPEGCPDQMICAVVRAMVGTSTLKGYVKEAKKRGLSCGMGEAQVINFQQAFILQSKLRRQQLQYALKKLGYYPYGIDGLWGKGTRSAFDKFLSVRGLASKTETQVFNSLLSEVDVPSSFAAPKKIVVAPQTTAVVPKQDDAGLSAIISNPSVTGRQAMAICGPQAKLAKSQASASAGAGRSNRRRTYDLDCSYGSCRARDVTPSGGMWGGILKGLTAANAGKAAYNGVMDSCLAQYGWRD